MLVCLWYAQAFANNAFGTFFRRLNIDDEQTSVVKRMCDVEKWSVIGGQ